MDKRADLVLSADWKDLPRFERSLYLFCVSAANKQGLTRADADYLAKEVFTYDNVSRTEALGIRDALVAHHPKISLVNVGDAAYLCIKELKANPILSAGRKEWHRISHKSRPAVLERDGYKCRQCGSTDNLEVDHILPIAHNGENDDANLQTLCKACNRRKWAHL